MVIFEPLFQLVTPDQWITVANHLRDDELMAEITVETLFAIWRNEHDDYPIAFAADPHSVKGTDRDCEPACLPCLSMDFGWHKLLIPCQAPTDLYPFTPGAAASSKVISLAHMREITPLVPDLLFSALEPGLQSWLSQSGPKRWMVVVSPLADLAPWDRPLHPQLRQLLERTNQSYHALMRALGMSRPML